MTTTKIEAKNPTQRLRDCAAHVDKENRTHREHAANIVKLHGFGVHVGGRHVAILNGTERLAIITGTDPDWN